MIAVLALALASTASPAADPMLGRMTALYEEVCLRDFPDDHAVDLAMAAKGAKPLTPEQVKITLVNDPGRGWVLTEGNHKAFVFLELPPYHACSVRWAAPGAELDLTDYHVIADRFMVTHPGFQPLPDYDVDQGGQHVHGTIHARALVGGGAELLLTIDQRVIDPILIARGQPAYEVRFVRQLRSIP